MNKQLLTLTVILAIVILAVAGGMWYKRGMQSGSSPRFAFQELKSDETSSEKKEVATDPSFPEYKGEIVAGFPSFPVYTGATLEASSKVNIEGEPDQGYRVLWISHDEVPKIMRWYETELKAQGWKIVMTDDPTSNGEQVDHISAEINGVEYTGYIAAEVEGNNVEIVADLRLD